MLWIIFHVGRLLLIVEPCHIVATEVSFGLYIRNECKQCERVEWIVVLFDKFSFVYFSHRTLCCYIGCAGRTDDNDRLRINANQTGIIFGECNALAAQFRTPFSERLAPVFLHKAGKLHFASLSMCNFQLIFCLFYLLAAEEFLATTTGGQIVFLGMWHVSHWSSATNIGMNTIERILQ